MTRKSGLPGDIGRGLVAGFVGTAAMTISSTLEARLRGREPSTAPADAAAKVLGIAEFESEEAKGRFSDLVHWGYGTGWGAARAVLRTAGLGSAAATAVHGGALWGSEQVLLPSLGVSPPITEWGPAQAAIDALHHAVYVGATAVAYGLLR